MSYGVADCVPPVHAVKHSEPPPNPFSGTIKICIDYDSSLFLQRVNSEILSTVEQRIWRCWQFVDGTGNQQNSELCHTKEANLGRPK
jgi:hypothetical protein